MTLSLSLRPSPYHPVNRSKPVISSNHNIEGLASLFAELKRYLELRGKLARVDLTVKVTRLLTALVLFAVLFLFAAVALIFLSMALATYLGDALDSPTTAYLIVVAAYVLLGLIVYIRRRHLIENPITRLLCNIFLSDTEREGASGGE